MSELAVGKVAVKGDVAPNAYDKWKNPVAKIVNKFTNSVFAGTGINGAYLGNATGATGDNVTTVV